MAWSSAKANLRLVEPTRNLPYINGLRNAKANQETLDSRHPPLVSSVTISIITPSFNQLDWLRLCVASVRDQVEPPSAGISEIEYRRSEGAAPISHIPSSVSVSPSDTPLRVEHIIQDAGSPGIEDFAREVGADFYHDGLLVFASTEDRRSKIENRGGNSPVSSIPSPSSPAGNPSPISHIPSSTCRYRISIYCESDSGMYDAINCGLTKSSGEICAWLNSDEQYMEGTLARVAGYFSADSDLEVLLGDALLVDSDISPLCYRRIMVPSKWHTRLAYLHSLSCAMFFRRSALPSPPLESRWKVISDALLMSYFLNSRRRIVACKTLLSSYAFTGINLSAGPLKAEKDKWWNEDMWPPKYLTPLVILYHRLRRFWNGAYATHRFHCALYTFSSQQVRKDLSDVGVAGTWPQIPS